MQPTLEIRWFFPHKPCAPDALFETLPAAETRTDWYAFPCHPHCGIKIREGKLEVKLLLQDLDAGEQSDAQEDMQRWGKWSSTLDDETAPSQHLLQANGWVAVRKRRYQQVFTLTDDQIRPATENCRNNCCQLEWTELALASEQWWTISMEAWGVEKSLAGLVQRVIAECVPDRSVLLAAAGHRPMSYPQWLNSCLRGSQQ